MPKPAWHSLAESFMGTREHPGSGSNPVIMGWASYVGVRQSYVNDGVPWCGLFAANIMKRSGFSPVAGPLRARNWANFGTALQRPSVGAIMVFKRGPSMGHVAFYVSEEANYYHILGGNQSNRVSVTKYAKNKLLAIRWPSGQPSPQTGVVEREVAGAGPTADDDTHAVFGANIGNSPGRVGGSVTRTMVYDETPEGYTWVDGDLSGNDGPMKEVAVVGDLLTHSAVITTGSTTRFIDGMGVARIDDLVNCPAHGINPIIGPAGSVKLDGKGIAVEGMQSQCGAVILPPGRNSVFSPGPA